MTDENQGQVVVEAIIVSGLIAMQEQANKTAVYPKANGRVYTTMGLAGEAGEVANIVKKLMLRGDMKVEDIFADPQPILNLAESLAKEMGDLFWYWLQMCTEFGFNADKIAQLMFEKLADRQERGTLKGSGDNR